MNERNDLTTSTYSMTSLLTYIRTSITQSLKEATNQNAAMTTTPMSSATPETTVEPMEANFEVFMPIIFGVFMIVALTLIVFYVPKEKEERSQQGRQHQMSSTAPRMSQGKM